jgi:hypothetical protein
VLLGVLIGDCVVLIAANAWVRFTKKRKPINFVNGVLLPDTHDHSWQLTTAGWARFGQTPLAVYCTSDDYGRWAWVDVGGVRWLDGRAERYATEVVNELLRKRNEETMERSRQIARSLVG